MQYQKYEAQELLSGFEYFLGAGSQCDLVIDDAPNRFGLELGALRNRAEYSQQLGGDRRGWQGNFLAKALAQASSRDNINSQNLPMRQAIVPYLRMVLEKGKPPFGVFELCIAA